MEKLPNNEAQSEEKIPMLSNTVKPKIEGGLITMPSIIVNESFEKVASYGLMPNLIFYLMNGYHLEAANGSIILSLWSAASNFLAIFGAFLSDSYLGRFRVIAIGTLASLLNNSWNKRGIVRLTLMELLSAAKHKSSRFHKFFFTIPTIVLILLFVSTNIG